MAKTSVSKGTKMLMMRRDNHSCQIGLPCCVGYASGPDHRAGRGAGGSKVLNELSNLIAACWPCNSLKETLHGEARKELVVRGVIIAFAGTNEKTAAKALVTPFIDRSGVAWLLDNDGGKTVMEL